MTDFNIDEYMKIANDFMDSLLTKDYIEHNSVLRNDECHVNLPHGNMLITGTYITKTKELLYVEVQIEMEYNGRVLTIIEKDEKFKNKFRLITEKIGGL